MKPTKQFLDELWESFMPLYEVAEIQTRRFFNNHGQDKEMLRQFFNIRVCNERWNMVELAQKVANLPIDTDPEVVRLLAKQVYDEAEHFRLVSEILEHLTGEKTDMNKIYHPNQKMGAGLLGKYEAQDNPIALSLYQFMAEGRASHIWHTMSKVANDEFIQTRYARIARDEKFHSKIGRLMLEKICVTEEAQQQTLEMVGEMIWDLVEISCVSLGDFKTIPDDAKQIIRDAYGEPPRQLRVEF